MNYKNQCYTLTFSESVENHKDMQIIGTKAKSGFSVSTLRKLAEKYNGEIVELTDLPTQQEAILVIFRNGCQTLFNINPDDAFVEQFNLKKDEKCKMYGRVVNKKARHNLCFSDFSQDPNYEEGMGTVIHFKDVPLLSSIRNQLGEQFGEEFKSLNAEGNYYYDINKCYIGFHGDSERKKVVGVRLGCDFQLHYRWYHKSDPVGEIKTITLSNGDIYIMSEKAVGNDWKLKNTQTLRHSAGLLKNIK
jgi:hypothetical protein